MVFVPTSDGLLGFKGVADHGLSLAGGFVFFGYVFRVLFEMMT
jgi:hypothetical protein